MTKKLLPFRPSEANKGDFGKVLLIAGSIGMAGSAYLNAKAAYYIGAGLVKIYTHEDNRIILQTLLPEAIVVTYREYEPEVLDQLFQWSDVLLMGSGVGLSPVSYDICNYVSRHYHKPLVIDGDGLYILSKSTELLPLLKEDCILTPHVKEMSRLLHIDVSFIKSNPVSAMQRLAITTSAIIVLKDDCTHVYKANQSVYRNTSGNECMAKAGSGDVLAGMIVGLLAQQMIPYDAACSSVYLHGLSGDYNKKRYGSYAVMAEDLIDGLREVTKNATIKVDAT